MFIQVARNSQGEAVRKEGVISGETILVGRGAGCKVLLQDHRVDLVHASIHRSEDGTPFIEAEADSIIHINGFVEQSGALSSGTRVEVGPYLLTVEAIPEGHDLAIAVEIIHAHPEVDKSNVQDRLDLPSIGLSKRRISLWLFAVLAFLFILLPMLPSVSSAFDSWQSNLPITLTDSWNPGELSDGHRVFGSKCSSCHQKPFNAVTNEACISCHKNTARHVHDKTLHDSQFQQMRCTTCHDDHKGKQGLVKHNPALCVNCHGDIRSMKADTQVLDVRDFSKSHPAFRIAIPDGKDNGRVNRIRQTEGGKISEFSGLKYSHKVHLDRNGISTPGGDVVMVCHDCHVLDESGNHFVPMTMRKSCQQSECHALAFDEPAEGDVPHGSEHEVLDKLRGFYMRWLELPSNRVLCAQIGGGEKMFGCANELAKKNAASALFSETEGCGECHEVRRSQDADVPWRVVPVQMNKDWQPGAVFPHVKHGTADCSQCHDKSESTNSGDVSMPKIEKCRECHVGEKTSKRKITSSCNSCHRYHAAK
ncbi:MAG: cytochrome c3 family protein [Gallionella sp.]|nr:cytochrome c3 family protein [Gallionella sp.]